MSAFPCQAIVSPAGPRSRDENSQPGDVFVSFAFGPVPYVGMVMKEIRIGEINTWGSKIMPLNPQDWKPEHLELAHPIVETPKRLTMAELVSMSDADFVKAGGTVGDPSLEVDVV